MYNKIVNPRTGRRVSVSGKLGRQIIRNYLNQLYISGGEPIAVTCEERALGESGEDAKKKCEEQGEEWDEGPCQWKLQDIDANPPRWYDECVLLSKDDDDIISLDGVSNNRVH